MNVKKVRALLIMLIAISCLSLFTVTAYASDIVLGDPISPVAASAITVNKTEVDLYGIDDAYKSYLTIPSSCDTTFTIKVSGTTSTPTYKVTSGDSVEVSSGGVLTIATTEVYNISSQAYYYQNNYGKSTVKVTVDSQTFYVYVTVHNYAVEYAEKVMCDYADSNITSGMTDLEKLEIVTKFPSLYNYSASYSSYTGMIVSGGGDCWSSTNAILFLCDYVGLPAHSRYGANDAGAGSGHRNVAVKIGDDVYIAEAGYVGNTPRLYTYYKENYGLTYYVSGGEATILQYDGFDNDIVVPSEISGYPVTTIGEKFLINSAIEPYSVTLPDTIKTIKQSAFNSSKYIKTINIPKNVSSIETFAFTNCTNLTSINVDSSNQFYTSVDGVVYNKEKTDLLFYPTAKAGTYEVLSGVKSIAEYSFYYSKANTVMVPSTVTSIGEGAFGTSSITDIYFSGNCPSAISDFAFAYLKLKAYYPKGNTTWSTLINSEEKYYASSLEWKVWNPNAIKLTSCSVTLSKTSYTYTGSALKPTPTVKYGSTTLIKGTDYTVSYTNNINSGTGYVIITAVGDGAGDYVGSTSAEFTINKATPTASFLTTNLSCGLLEENISNTFTTNSDGKVTYSSSNTLIATVSSTGNITPVSVGSCTVTANVAEGINYKATSLSYTLIIKNLKAQTITVAKSFSKTYGDTSFSINASALGGATLTYVSGDTSVVTVDSTGKVTIVKPGDTTITVRALGNDSYMGAVTTVSIFVNPKDISECTPFFKCIGDINQSKVSSSVGIISGSNILTLGNDFNIYSSSYSYSNTTGNISYLSAYVVAKGDYYTGSADIYLEPIRAKSVLTSAARVSTGIKLTWEKEEGAIGYYIYRQIGSGNFEKAKTITKKTVTSWTDTSATDEDTSYTYYIAAYTHNGTKYITAANSNTKKVSATPVGVPTITSAVCKNSSATEITWSAVSGATSYRLYVSTTSATGGWSTVTDTTDTKFTHTGLKSGNTYYYTVAAYRNSVKSKYNSGVAVTVIPPTPAIQSAEAIGARSIKVTWDKASGATGYVLYRSTTPSGSWTRLTTVKSTAYTDSKAVPGTNYYYTVKAYVTANGKNYYSGYIKTGVGTATAFVKPKMTSAEAVGFNSVKLAWSEGNTPDGYIIYRSTKSSSGWSRLATVKGTVLTYTDKTAKYNTQYYYIVRSYVTVDGTNYYSKYYTPGIAGKAAAVQPTFKVASNGYNSVKISWTAVGQADGYRIYRSTRSDGKGWTRIATVTDGTTTSYYDNTVTCGTTYYYTISTYKKINGSTVVSKYLKEGLSCVPVPAKPKVTAKQQKNLSVLITWGKIAGATKYKVYRREPGGSWSVISIINSGSTVSYTDKPTNTTIQYEYTVRALRGTVLSKFTAVKMVMYSA